MVRVANNSHYDCKVDSGNTLESETACGFVVEFVDIVEEQVMNESEINIGGWPATNLYKYLNGTYNDIYRTWERTNTFYSKLSPDLQRVIADTIVISSHGKWDNQNFKTTDKLYLFSAKELLNYSGMDSASKSTRQLDFYEGLSYSSYGVDKVKKKYNDTFHLWFLRVADLSSNIHFYSITGNGTILGAYGSGGLSPAFRIG